MSSLLADYFVRSAGTGHIFNDLVRGLPFVDRDDLRGNIVRLFLRLNCLTEVYAPLWKDVTGEEWTSATPIRNAFAGTTANNTSMQPVDYCPGQF